MKSQEWVRNFSSISQCALSALASLRSFNLFSNSMNALNPGSISANGSISSFFADFPPNHTGILFFFAFNASLARCRAPCHSSISSRYISHTQCTHPLHQSGIPRETYDIQQLSGSSGRGGTLTPSTIRTDCGSGPARGAGPANREPKMIF